MTQMNSTMTPGTANPPTSPVTLHGPRPMVTRISRRAVLLAAVFGAALGLAHLWVEFAYVATSL